MCVCVCVCVCVCECVCVCVSTQCVLLKHAEQHRSTLLASWSVFRGVTHNFEQEIAGLLRLIRGKFTSTEDRFSIKRKTDAQEGRTVIEGMQTQFGVIFVLLFFLNLIALP